LIIGVKQRNTFLLAILCAALVTGAVAAAGADGTVDKAKAADQALHGGQAALAVRLYGEALQAPNFVGMARAHALLNRGLAYEQMGHRIEAVLDFTDAILLKVFPREDLARAFLDRGVALDELGRADEALADYSAAIVLVPQFPAALNNRANAYRRRGDLQKARSDYQASLVSGNATPEYPLYGLGQIAEAEGNRGAAAAFYRQAYAVNPGFTLAAKRLAALQSEAGLRGTAQPNSVQPLRGPR
jgi:tetratricopeptide (TPR) repeat protein